MDENKLKTLENITYHCKEQELEEGLSHLYTHKENLQLAAIKDLRQSAIEWIKELQNESIEKGTDGNFRLLVEDGLEVSNKNVVDWVEHFFNITEEELKRGIK